MNKLKASVLMRHEVGLHARPSVKLTKLAKGFESKIDLGLSPDGPWIDAKSIVKVMATKAPKDSTIYFRAEGHDAKAALDALVMMVDGDFQDGPEAASARPPRRGEICRPGHRYGAACAPFRREAADATVALGGGRTRGAYPCARGRKARSSRDRG